MIERQPLGDDSPGSDSRDDTHERSHSSQPESRDTGDPTKGESAFGAGLGASTEEVKSPARKKRKRSPRSSSKPKGDGDGDGASSDDKKKRSRRSRAGASKTSDEPEARQESSDTQDEPSGGRKKRSRGKRGGRKKAAARAAAEPAAEPAAEEKTEDAAAPKRRRRGSRGGRRRKGKTTAVEVETIPFEDDELPDFPELPEDTELIASDSGRGGKKRKRASRSNKAKATRSPEDGEAKKTSRRSRAKKPASETARKAEVDREQVILVNAVDREEKRVAVCDGTRIIDFLMTSDSQKTLVNDIYRGKVVNLEPAIGAAFIDFGQGRNGFLHTSDVLGVYGEDGFDLSKLMTASVDPEDWEESSSKSDIDDADGDGDADADGHDEDAPSKGSKKGASRRGKPRRQARQRLPISDLLRVGDQVVVQITKDAIGDKGPTLTTYISIPGRYLVLMPSMSRTGVSRKIPDDKERRRLKRILSSMKIPADMGVIVRTAGVGKTKTDLQRDIDYLLGVWETFGKRLKVGRGPVPLYQESDVAIRTLRDLFNSKTDKVVVDDPIVYEQLVEFAEKLMPDQVERIEKHDGDRPLFHHHGIEQDFEKIFARRAELPSGGSIVFDQTEALVAIDVNSGRTRTKGFDFEEIALKTNLEAVPEIARQIRLRDLGGIIVCDFIDMIRTSSQRQVERSLRNELADDRARSKLGRISQFGLLEMTRQRLGPGTHKKVFQACGRCRGTGRVRTVPSRAAAILRRLGSALTQKGFSTVELRAHPEVVDYLENDVFDYVRALEHRFEKGIQLTPVAEQAEDSVLRYLRADGREVRPGGRRKR